MSRRDDQFSQAGGAVPYLPLTPEEAHTGNGASDDRSIGALVKDASTHMSALVRAEVELAKAEVVGEVKKGVKGSVFFIIALVVALYSSFFFFFFLGELLSTWLDRWAAFGIVFVLMVLFAGLMGLLGYLKVRKIKAPEKTISSVKETAAALKPKQADSTELTAPGDGELTTR
ncbi:MAG: phage holin family protein [Thermocrispum sp.]